MPRDSQGLYSLPAGNPVTPGTLIESQWANTTMPDIGSALTNSLPRDGSAPMVGQLTLSTNAPTQARHATSKAYVDQFMAFATGMPLGAVFAFAAGTVPSGYLVCDGTAVSRTTYDQLFALIGTTYGSGDNATTFNLPDLKDQFIRGKGDSRTVGSLQGSAFASHLHPIVDPGHTHAAVNPTHTHADTGHVHSVTITDPGHVHSLNITPISDSGNGNPPRMQSGGTSNSNAAVTGITAVADLGHANIAATAQATTVSSAITGIASGATGDTETRPQNIAMVYFIKAVNDSISPSAAILGVTSSDVNVIDIDNSNVLYPNLVIKSNVAFGLAKLDSGGKVPVSQMPFGAQSYLGPFDASGGLNPSQAFPTHVYASGNTYVVSVAGTILVYNPVSFTSAMTLVPIGRNLVYLSNGTNPVGWYNMANAVTVTAQQVGFNPFGSITATEVQTALEQLDTSKGTVSAAGVVKSDGTAFLPAVDGTDYLSPTGAAVVTNKTIDYTLNTLLNFPATTVPAAGMVKSNGTVLQTAVSGTDYASAAFAIAMAIALG